LALHFNGVNGWISPTNLVGGTGAGSSGSGGSIGVTMVLGEYAGYVGSNCTEGKGSGDATPEPIVLLPVLLLRNEDDLMGIMVGADTIGVVGFERVK
jgi:hypothetical protein